MSDVLSIWRSPLDKVAISCAETLRDKQPKCIVYYEDLNAMTIYNFGYYDHKYSSSNDDALTHMFADMGSASPIGGRAFIPQKKYTVTASSSGQSVPDQCVIEASGGGGKTTGGGSPTFYHFDISGTGGAGLGFVFLNCAGLYTAGGKYFRGIAFHWTGSTNPSDACIRAGTWNCRAIRCTFYDCPVAFAATGTSCTLEQCTVDYTQGPDGATAVIISGSQCAVLGPGAIFQNAGNTPATCTGVSVEGPADHTVIANVHLSDWNIGVDFSKLAGSANTSVSNCEVQCNQNALNIQLPQNALGAKTTGVKITSCILAKNEGSNSSDAAVKVDSQYSAGFNTNAQLSDISLIDCTVFSQASTQMAGQHGLEIVGGTNIRVLGGTFSNNGNGGGAGIAITGACGEVQIIGANLQRNYAKSKHVYNQTYALAVSGGPLGTLFVSDCDMSGYPGLGITPAVSVSGTPRLFIYNCLGYNDLNSTLNHNVAPTSSTNAATCNTPYFGPSLFFFSNPTTVTLTVFGQTMNWSIGIIFLPSPFDSFYFATPPSTFAWIGK